MLSSGSRGPQTDSKKVLAPASFAPGIEHVPGVAPTAFAMGRAVASREEPLPASSILEQGLGRKRDLT